MNVLTKCNFCESSGDNFDFLTGYKFCCNCFSELSKTSRRIYFDHAKEKLKERYGLELTEALYNEIVSQISDQSKNTIIANGKTRDRNVHRVIIDGIKIFVVYKKARKGAIVTVLPKSTFIRGIKFK